MELKSVFAGFVGAPNAGKSTLINRLTGMMVSIVTDKPQTTRTAVTGVLTKDKLQYVLTDTPGYLPARNSLDYYMEKIITSTLQDADVIVFLFQPDKKMSKNESDLLQMALQTGKPLIAVLNKVDLIKTEKALHDRVMEIEALADFESVHVISALSGAGCEPLLDEIAAFAKESPHFYPQDAFTNLDEKQQIAEIIRQKLWLHLHQEVPYGTAVEITGYKQRKNSDIVDIDATIYCEKPNHKGMIIGKNGQNIKKIATAARKDIERYFGFPVYLQSWVKVLPDWRDNEQQVLQLGFI